MKTINTLLAIVCLALGATQLSCSVNDYCLNCGTGDAGGSGTGDADDSGMIDAPVDAGCVPSGNEVCDDKDNDCNGLIDDGVLPEVGDLCANQMGVCSGGVKECVSGALKCSKTGSPEICDGLDNNCNGSVDEGDPGGGGKCGTEMGECVAGTLRCAATSGCSGAANCDPLTQNCCVKCFGNDNLPWVGGQYDTRNDPELCNAKDDNCNGQFDEGLASNTACTWAGATNTGECNIGTLACQGGSTVCVGAVFPKFEICNGLDDDCDGQADEIFSLTTDPTNCGSCGNVCLAKPKTCSGGTNAKMTCTQASDCPGGSCDINSQPKCAPNGSNVGTCGYQCNVGFIDLDGSAANGCEYKCSPTGNEECDGIDNNCNGTIDEGVTAPANLCLQGGECGTTTAACMGAQGWKCNYPGATEFPEVSCDAKDNNCDGNIDEPFPLKNTSCDDGGIGACLDVGTYICDPADATKLKCNITTSNTASTETCNGKDDDCDGTIDNTDGSGNLAGQDWVSLGNGKFMMKYEASKPDATATNVGVVTTITNAGTTRPQVCSKAGVQPWTNVTYTQARAACQAIGADLCSESQWHHMCSAVASPTFPLSVTTGTAVFAEAEDYTGIAVGGTSSGAESGTECSNALDDDGDGFVNDGCPASGGAELTCSDALDNETTTDGLVNDGCPTVSTSAHAWTPDYTNGFSGIAAMQATPNTPLGRVSLSRATTLSSRLDYTFNFTQTSASYHIWLKMYQTGIASSNRVAYVRLGAGALVSLSTPAPTACTSNANCSALAGGTCIDSDANNVVDSCSGFQWIDGGTFNVAATGNQTVSVFMGDDGVKVDKVGINTSATAPTDTILSKGGRWSYFTNPTTYQATTCNGQDFNASNDDIRVTGSLANCKPTSGDVFDLSGNVKEWTLAQKPGENPIRGGASNSTDVGITCALNFTLANDTFLFPNIGFRCCK